MTTNPGFVAAHLNPLARPALDALAAREERDRAIERVDSAAPSDWRTVALDAVRTIARSRARFTTDDVWSALYAAGIESPPEPRALGAIMIAVAREGLIEATMEIEQSARVACHARPLRVWRSRIVPPSADSPVV